MNTIKFNNHIYEVTSFSKNTYFNVDGSFSSTASCQVKTTDITSLHTLAGETVSVLQIYHDDNLIYNLEDLNGKLTSIDEYLSDERVNINLNFNFNINVEENSNDE